MNELISPRKDIAVGEKLKTLVLDTSSLPIAARLNQKGSRSMNKDPFNFPNSASASKELESTMPTLRVPSVGSPNAIPIEAYSSRSTPRHLP